MDQAIRTPQIARDALGRRSRFQRVRTGKRIQLGERDLDILALLYRYRYLRQTQLAAFLEPRSQKRFVERLGDLFHETGLINRPAAQHGVFDARCTPLIYEISRAGTRYLETLNAVPSRAVTFSFRAGRSYSPQFLHTMMIIDCLVAIELAIRQTPGQRFVPVDEILARAPDTTRLASNPLSVPVTLRPSPKTPQIRARRETHLIPDALYGIEYAIDGEKRYRFWALECERTTPKSRSNGSGSSTALKHAAYDALIRSGAFKTHWGIPNLKLHLVTLSDYVPGVGAGLPHSPNSKAG